MEHTGSCSVLNVLIQWAKTNVIKDNIAPLETGDEIRLEVNAENTKYMVMSRHQNAG